MGDDDIFAGYALPSSGEDMDRDSNSIQENTTIFESPRTAGAPAGKKQQRKAKLFTQLICCLDKQGLQDRRKRLPFVLKHVNNNKNLAYWKCYTHHECKYMELVRKTSDCKYAVWAVPNLAHSSVLARHVVTSMADIFVLFVFICIILLIICLHFVLNYFALYFFILFCFFFVLILFIGRDDTLQSGIHPRWYKQVDMLIESGQTPSAIRTDLLLDANRADDKEIAKKVLPTGSLASG